MQSPPILFDADLLARRRARAEGVRPRADFLRDAVGEDLTERLIEVNRSFSAPVLIGDRPGDWAAALAGSGAGVREPRLLAPADHLDLEPGSVDLVVHALALHWSNDPVGQLAQARRALAPDGLFLGALFGGESLRELRIALAEAEVEVLGGLSPRVAPMGEIRDLGALLQRAGFAMPVADCRRFDVTYPSVLNLMRDLRAMGETNVMLERRRRPMRREMLVRTAEIYADRFGGPDGRVRATFEVVFLTGWAPSPDQPKPLRPGSARASLAAALEAPPVSDD